MVEKVEDLKQEEESRASIFLLFGEIDTDSAKGVCEWILNANFTNGPVPSTLNLMINSNGGDMNACFSMIDIMESSQIPVRTIGVGQIASAGLMLFLAGEKGQRVLTPRTSIMSHAYSWGSAGKHHELIAVQKEFNLTFQRQLDHYIKTTGLTEAKVKKFLLPHEDVYLSAEEAVQLGVADRIALVK